MKKQHSLHDLEKAFVSPIDQFLSHFDETHPETLSQMKERVKYQEIAEKRDDPFVEPVIEIWENF